MLPLTLVAVLLASVVGMGPSFTQSSQGTQGQWPVAFPIILRGFTAPSTPYGPGHRGVDLAARVGDSVVAPMAGTVSFAGSVAGTPVVTLTHAGNLRTTYEPAESDLAVGVDVSAGESFAVVSVGMAHCGLVPPCLHWGALRGSNYIDPVSLIFRVPPVLLPVPDSAGGEVAPNTALAGQRNTGQSSPIAPVLPIAIATGALGAGFFIRRRRRRVSLVAAAQPWYASDRSGFP